jgi:hypothetical protein
MPSFQNQFLDVIVTSSGRKTIFPTMESFLANVKFKGCFRFIVNVDLCIPKYLDDIKKIFSGLNVKCFNVNHTPQGFTRSLDFVIRRVETPLYFHLEDDWLFNGPIEIDPILNLFRDFPAVNHLCLSKKKILPYNELFYLRKLKFIPVDCDFFKTKNVTVGGINLVETFTYSANPNISRTSHFQNLWRVKSLNLEQQFALQNFLLGGRRGYYILGKIGDEAIVSHIG